MQTLRLGILGDFDLFEFEGKDPFLVKNDEDHFEFEDPDMGDYYVPLHIIFWVTSMAITVILMNLLIGVIGNAYDMRQEKARIYFIRERAAASVTLRRRPWFPIARWLYRWFFRGDDERKFVFVLSREERNPDDFQSMRGVLKNELSMTTMALNNKMGDLKNELGMATRALDSKVEGMRSELTAVKDYVAEMSAAIKRIEGRRPSCEIQAHLQG